MISFERTAYARALALACAAWMIQGCSSSTGSENRTPQVEQVLAGATDVVANSGPYVGPNAYINEISLQAVATDPDGDPLTYNWSTTGGEFYLQSGDPLTSNPTAIRNLPVGQNRVTCIANDGSATGSGFVDITVRCPLAEPTMAPTLTAPADGATFATGGGGAVITYEFDLHALYRWSLEVSSSSAVDADGGFSSIVREYRNLGSCAPDSSCDGRVVFQDPDPLPPGTYFWHIAIVLPCQDGNVVEDFWSAIRSFTIE